MSIASLSDERRDQSSAGDQAANPDTARNCPEAITNRATTGRDGIIGAARWPKERQGRRIVMAKDGDCAGSGSAFALAASMTSDIRFRQFGFNTTPRFLIRENSRCVRWARMGVLFIFPDNRTNNQLTTCFLSPNCLSQLLLPRRHLLDDAREHLGRR